MTHPKKGKIIVLCSDAATLRAIDASLGRDYDLLVAGESGRARTLVQLVQELVAVVVDCACASGIHLLKSAISRAASVRRVLISDHGDLGPVVQALHAGAIDQVVYKPVQPVELIKAVSGNAEPSLPPRPPPSLRIPQPWRSYWAA